MGRLVEQLCAAALIVSCRAAVPGSDVARARTFDYQGVLAYEAGRYNDAIRFFEAALGHGGPPSERWNIARCLLKLDEPERADETLAAYLAVPGLGVQDRRDATATLEEIRRRPSTLTVVTVPPGAPFTVDGKRLGVTPASVSVAPGPHVVVIDRAPNVREEQRVEAHFGRAIIVEVPAP